jgi:hypothetical protein
MALFTTVSLFSKRSSAFVARVAPRRQLSTKSTATMASTTRDNEQLVQDMLYRIRQVNHMPEEVRSSLIDFQVEGVKLGKVRHYEATRIVR